MKLFVFGHGFAGRALERRLAPLGWEVAGTTRSAPRRYDGADAVLIAAPPTAEGCPGFASLAPALSPPPPPAWLGYLSTTGVYGDRGGGWVFETSELRAHSVEGARRAAAERDWLGLGAAIFRLPGIYGPGRSAFDRLREGKARRLVKPGHVFSRIHVDDLAAGLAASIARPNPSRVYNLCDDAPTGPDVVTAYAARLLGMEPPPEEAFDASSLSPMARRFWAESKRVSNARAKAELGWRPAYPTYREGLEAVLAADERCGITPDGSAPSPPRRSWRTADAERRGGS